MAKRLVGVMLALVLTVSVSSVALSQEKKDMEKRADKSANVLKSVSCDPLCGFKVQSHDEKELTSIVISHVKNAHNKDITADDVKAMMKTVSPKKSKTT